MCFRSKKTRNDDERERETPMWSKRGTTTDAVLVVDVRDGNVLLLLVEEDGR